MIRMNYSINSAAYTALNDESETHKSVWHSCMVWKRTRAEHHECEGKSRLVDQFPKDDWNQYKQF